MLYDISIAPVIMKRQVRKVTKQLPAKSFTEAVRKLLYTKLTLRDGVATDS